MDKKGVELAFNTIIIGVLVMIVLVVVVMIFTGQMEKWVDKWQGINSCENQDGHCAVDCVEGEIALPDEECASAISGSQCCIGT